MVGSSVVTSVVSVFGTEHNDRFTGVLSVNEGES